MFAEIWISIGGIPGSHLLLHDAKLLLDRKFCSLLIPEAGIEIGAVNAERSLIVGSVLLAVVAEENGQHWGS